MVARIFSTGTITALFICTVLCPFSVRAGSIETAGDVIQIVNPVAAFAMSYMKDDKEGIKQIFMVSAATFVTTQVLKTGLNNVRIGDKKLGDRPDGGGNNFPSGHTSSAFSAAWYIKKRYGLKNAAIPLIGAAFTAYSRVHSKKHDVAAVVGGALLGIAVAEVFTGKFEGGIPVLSLNTGSEESLYVGFMIDF